MPAYSNHVVDLIDRTGIEVFFGATPAQLPRLSEGKQQALRTDDLPALQRLGLITVDADLLQADPNLARTEQALSAPAAVVRVDRRGLESKPAQFWVFAKNGHIVQLFADPEQGGHYQLTSLADSAALFAAIEQLAPLSWMPHKAYARVVLDRGDAEDVFDQVGDDGSNVATELLVSNGLTDEQAQVAFDVMRTGWLAGRISFMRVYGDTVELTYGVTVGQDGGDIWMAFASPLQSAGLVLETVLKGALHHQLEEGWISLRL